MRYSQQQHISIVSIPDIRHSQRVKSVELSRIHGNTDTPSFRMDTEGALEQMVDALTHVNVQSRVAVLEGNLSYQLTASLGPTLRDKGDRKHWASSSIHFKDELLINCFWFINKNFTVQPFSRWTTKSSKKISQGWATHQLFSRPIYWYDDTGNSADGKNIKMTIALCYLSFQWFKKGYTLFWIIHSKILDLECTTVTALKLWPWGEQKKGYLTVLNCVCWRKKKKKSVGWIGSLLIKYWRKWLEGVLKTTIWYCIILPPRLLC